MNTRWDFGGTIIEFRAFPHHRWEIYISSPGLSDDMDDFKNIGHWKLSADLWALWIRDEYTPAATLMTGDYFPDTLVSQQHFLTALAHLTYASL